MWAQCLVASNDPSIFHLVSFLSLSLSLFSLSFSPSFSSYTRKVPRNGRNFIILPRTFHSLSLPLSLFRSIFMGDGKRRPRKKGRRWRYTMYQERVLSFSLICLYDVRFLVPAIHFWIQCGIRKRKLSRKKLRGNFFCDYSVFLLLFRKKRTNQPSKKRTPHKLKGEATKEKSLLFLRD